MVLVTVQKSAKSPKESDRAMKESKTLSKQRALARRSKLESHYSDIEASHSEEKADGSPPLGIPPNEASVSRSSSDPSGSVSNRKARQTSRDGGLLDKTSSLSVPPTGVISSCEDQAQERSTKFLEVKKRLQVCETTPQGSRKKKLNLENMQLVEADVPMTYVHSTPLGNTLYKLSLAKNPLRGIPPKLVQCLPMLSHLDLSQCELVSLPVTWNLPQLKKLNLSHNKLTDFPDEVSNNTFSGFYFSDPCFLFHGTNIHNPPHPSNRRC
jgi:Leucine-rich repeat (LRR) protein